MQDFSTVTTLGASAFGDDHSREDSNFSSLSAFFGEIFSTTPNFKLEILETQVAILKFN